MFLLTPVIFNQSFMTDSVEGAYTLTIPIKEMSKFKTQDDLHDFLMYHYNDLFFVQNSEMNEMKYEFYFQKKAELEMQQED